MTGNMAGMGRSICLPQALSSQPGLGPCVWMVSQGSNCQWWEVGGSSLACWFLND